MEVMQNRFYYIKDSIDIMKKIKHLKIIPDNAILVVTTDVLGLYPSIPYEVGLRALKEELSKRREKKISSKDFVKITEFVLKKNYFEFNVHWLSALNLHQICMHFHGGDRN